MSSSSLSTEPFPGSVEEAGALLGATITVCGKQIYTLQSAPDRMHSAFAITQPVPSQELLTRLYALRALLRAEAIRHDNLNSSFPAAPSLLQVLKKIMGVSTQLAAVAAQAEINPPKAGTVGQTRRCETPPLLSTPLRTLWVDCVVICHQLGDRAKVETAQFVRQMLAIAILNPRSQKASGGVRIAALDVIGALFEDNNNNNDGQYGSPKKMTKVGNTSLAQQLAPWSLDVLNVSLRALRSAGTGEPSYRVSAVRAACGTAVACRKAHLEKLQRLGSSSDETSGNADVTMWLKGAMEDRAIYEAVKVLKQAVSDKFPEVRSAAATFASLLAPLLILSSPLSTSGAIAYANEYLICLEEVIVLATKNLDDESPMVADGWAEALARCISTAIRYNQQSKGDNSTDDGQKTPTGGTRKYYNSSTAGSISSIQLATLPRAVAYLVDLYVKAGGELSAARAGGTFSIGGRSIRLGFCLALCKLLQLQRNEIGESRRMSIHQAVQLVLGMVGDDVEKSLKQPSNQETPASTSLFGSGSHRMWSRADAGLVTTAACRVLRQGLWEMSAEPVQIAILQDLIHLLPNDINDSKLNVHQVQVILTEVSHLFVTLGEASAARIEDALSRLRVCLCHANHGIRHEAALTLVAIATCFPREGRKFTCLCLEEMKNHLSELQSIVSSIQPENNEPDLQASRGLGMFRRSAATATQSTNKAEDSARPHQYAVHGKALFVSMMVQKLPKLPGGLSMTLVGEALSIAEDFVSFQYNHALRATSVGIAVSCARAGFCIIAGVLTSGPSGVATHMPLIVGMWQKACHMAKNGSQVWSAKYDLHILDACLTSIVSFLKYCSELLLTVPEALNKLTLMLEDAFDLLKPKGRLGSLPPSSQLVARLESAKASVFESFAWLPSGSFPVVADHVFTLSVQQIREAVDENVTCSLLQSLVDMEDQLTDAKPFSRVKRDGESGGARELEESVISLTAEVALHAERESVIHLRSEDPAFRLDEQASIRESKILQHYASDRKVDKAPTPLHEIATWRKPLDPSNSSKVRLVDAAIQSFAATFGLKDGHEQDKAMALLESLVPPVNAQLARSMGINAVLNEPDRRSKAPDEAAAMTNITAVLLCCLQALPIHESNPNVAIGLGPPWMNKAKDLFLTFLPASSTIVRRAAAEGLSMLATLGVTEDAHFLQSTVLHSLDEVMRGYKPDGKSKAIALESISAARAGSLFTLACIQRTSYKVKQKQLDRARGRIVGSNNEKAVDKAHENLPVLQMMTRILPAVSCYGYRDYFVVKTYAIHSFAVLLAYSSRLDMEPMSDEDKQLLLKGVELVDDNFIASWTSASVDVDRGQEADKMTAEIAFLAVLLRLMTFLVPFLHKLLPKDPDIARRFSLMSTMILDIHGSHPTITVEAMAFFEVLSNHQDVLPRIVTHVCYSENPLFSCIPSALASLTPVRPALFAGCPWCRGQIMASVKSLRSSVHIVKVLSTSQICVTELTGMKAVSLLTASLEAACGSRRFTAGNLLRSLAAGREAERIFAEELVLEAEIFSTVPYLLLLEHSFHEGDTNIYLRWILLARNLLAGTNTSSDNEEFDSSRSGVIAKALSQAAIDSQYITNPVRSSVKCLGAHIAACALGELMEACQFLNEDLKESSHFDIVKANKECAKDCAESAEKKTLLPSSKLVFHLEDVLASACMSCVASVDQAEIRTLQESSIQFLRKLIQCFGPLPDPEDASVSVLDQYATQIFSSIRHALMAPEECLDVCASRLFVAGCEALHSCIEAKVTSDSMILKRLLRPAIPLDNHIRFVKFGDAFSEVSEQAEDKTSTVADIVVHCTKIWTSGRILLGSTVGGDLPEYLENISNELIKDKFSLAIHAAATAIDAVHVLYGSGLSLVGTTLNKDDERSLMPFDCGSHLQNMADADDNLKEMLGKAWSSCARCAISPILAVLLSESVLEERRKACIAWIQGLIPVLVSGINDGIAACTNVSSSEPSPAWSNVMDTTSILLDCLGGLAVLINDGPEFILDESFGPEMEKIIEICGEVVVMPVLRGDSDRFHSTVVTAVCNLFCHAASVKGDVFRIDSALLVCMLQPLDMVQKHMLDFESNQVDEIISACLRGLSSLISQGRTTEALVRATVHLVVDSIFPREFLTISLNESSRGLVKACLERDVLSLNEKCQIACSLALSHNWEAWSVVSSIDDGMAALKSFDVVHVIFNDLSDSHDHLKAVAAILSLFQKLSVPGPLLGRLCHGLGSDILGILYLYGTNKVGGASARKHRTKLCADAMKIMLLAYQQAKADDDATGDKVVLTFISVFFQTLLAVLRFNGLPNYPSPEAAGDVALGRICGQAILHTARTTPVAFKECVSLLTDIDRTLLEFAVRAEMTGYAVTQAPAKKKLDLANFKK